MLPVTLEVDPFLHVRPAKNVMATPNALLEAEAEQESAKILKADVGVASALQDPFEQFAMLRHVPILTPRLRKLGALLPRV